MAARPVGCGGTNPKKKEGDVASDVYSKLREQLDQYSIGYPETESGVEIKILKKLFTEDEARMFLNLSLMPEAPQAVAKRLKLYPGHIEELLEGMTRKGLLFCLVKRNEKLYSAIPFIVGIYEYQINNIERELAELLEQYMEEGFADRIVELTPPLRPIAVHRSINVAWTVAPYEDIRAMIREQKEVAVAKCICRIERRLLNEGCDKPLEVCLSFGSQARHYVEIGMARPISQEEALKIADLCDEAGLVPQPTNSKKVLAICNCCGDCCGVLRSLKKLPRPAERVLSNYYAEVDPNLCSACETCVERCQMDAIALEETAAVDLDRCIGCGLCVTTCPTGAISLLPKPKEKRREPPEKFVDTMMEIAETRGTSLVPFSFRERSS